MFKAFISTTFRIYKRNWLYTGINIAGLSLALMVCFFTYLYIADELDYDDFHKDPDQLHLLGLVYYRADVSAETSIFDVRPTRGTTKYYSQNHWSKIEKTLEDLPEVLQVLTLENTIVHFQENDGSSIGMINYVSPDFFKDFGFKMLHGSRNRVLNHIDGAVISRAFAMRHFGKTQVLGDTLRTLGKADRTFIIEGVMSGEENSVLDFDLLVRNDGPRNHEGELSPVVFLRLAKSADLAGITSRLRQSYLLATDIDVAGKREELHLSAENPVVDYELTPINEVYLDPSVRYGKGSHPIISLILGAITVMLLTVACMNYLAISVASSAKRRTEIAVRKVIGARSLQLKAQFYTEAFFIVMLAVLGGFTLMQIFMPQFNELAQKSISLSLSEDLKLFLIAVLFGVFLTAITGSYPAQVLSRLKLLEGLKNGGTYHMRFGAIRAMTTFQFLLCLGFLSMAIGMRSQFQYIYDKELGFNKNELLLFTFISSDKAALIKEKLSASPEVVSSARFGGIFGSSNSRNKIIGNRHYNVANVRMDDDLFETLGLGFTSRPGYPEPERFSPNKLYLNEYYFDRLVQDTAAFEAMSARIGGVVKDFHFRSLYHEIGPISFELSEKKNLWSYVVRLAPGKTTEGVEAVKEAYAEVINKPLYTVNFLDDFLSNPQEYKNARRWQKLVNTSTALGIAITCIGLFGMMGMVANNRLKEMSIRRVLGARLNDVFYLFSKPVLLMLLLAATISIPISYLILQQWLNSFAYHVGISPMLFAVAVLMLLIIVVFTISFHSLKVQKLNPADILKEE